MLKKFLLYFVFILPFFISAQNTITIKGKITDSNTDASLESATVYVKTVKDSSVVDYTISSSNGNFQMKLKKSDLPHILKISYNGFSEFSIFPHWYIGCWGTIQYFTFKNNEWKNFGFARANICEEFTFEKHLKIISSKKIKVMEVYPNKDYSEMIQRYKTLKLD